MTFDVCNHNFMLPSVTKAGTQMNLLEGPLNTSNKRRNNRRRIKRWMKDESLKLEMDELQAVDSRDSSPHPEEAKQTKGTRRKRNRKTRTRRRKKELADPCVPMLPEGFLENLPEVVKGKIKDPCASVLPAGLLED